MAARRKVNALQYKLLGRAMAEPGRCFDGIYNLVYDRDVVTAAVADTLRKPSSDTPGIDGICKADIRKLGEDAFAEEIIEALKTKKYDFGPSRRADVSKASGGSRTLEIPSLRDRAAERCVATILEPILEADFLPSNHAYRPARGAHCAAEHALRVLATPTITTVVRADVESFFPNIEHRHVIEALKRRVRDKHVLGIVARYMRRPLEGHARRKKGLSQGGGLSPLLANAVLHPVDEQVPSIVGVRDHLRYADDFLLGIAGDIKAGTQACAELNALLSELGLGLNKNKTVVASVADPTRWLGYMLHRTSDGLVVAEPATEKIESLKKKLSSIVGAERSTTTNEGASRIVNGWAAYFSHAPGADALAQSALDELRATPNG